MAKPKKYRRGRKIADFREFVDYLEVGCWFYMSDATRPTHPAWLSSMQYRTLKNLVRWGQMTIAIRNLETDK